MGGKIAKFNRDANKPYTPLNAFICCTFLWQDIDKARCAIVALNGDICLCIKQLCAVAWGGG